MTEPHESWSRVKCPDCGELMTAHYWGSGKVRLGCKCGKIMNVDKEDLETGRV